MSTNQFKKGWKASIKPRNQRKYRVGIALHAMRKFLSCHLSKDLRTKYGHRNIGVRKGDKVKVLRGTWRGKTGEVRQVWIRRSKVTVEGIEIIRKNGAKVFVPLEVSNLMIISLNTDDKRRVTAADTAPKTTEKPKAKTPLQHSSASSPKNQGTQNVQSLKKRM